MKRLAVISFLGLAIGVLSCNKDPLVLKAADKGVINVPEFFPQLIFPEGNEFTRARWELGKKLFYDPVLSVDSSISCASCHKPELAFSDNKKVSPGVMDRPGTRNAPSLANVGFHPYFTREGGVPTLEQQVLVPIQEHNEFDFNIVKIAERLEHDSGYMQLSRKAYDRMPDSYVIVRAIATFERSLVSGNSRYDQFAVEGKMSLTTRERAGMDLFFSNRTNCAGCHGGYNFTSYAFANNGLYENYTDVGRKRLTSKDEDEALFKVPGLRNIELTAPYMHDGSVLTLEAVVEHYNRGGANHPNKSPLIRPLGLNPNEKDQLVAFLKCLTDHEFIENSNFRNQK